MNLPPQAFLEITRACNQACPFCSCLWFQEGESVNAERRELSIDEWKEVASELIANGVRIIGVTGGEPTLKSGWMELLRHLKAELEKHHPKQHELALFTNGKEFRPEWRELLQECGAKPYVSLPGLTTFSKQTGQRDGDFREVLRLIASLRELTVTAGITVTKCMLPELYETISYAMLSGAERVMLNLFKPSGRGGSHPELLLTDKDVLFAAQTAETVVAKCHGTIFCGGEFPPYIRQEEFPHLKIETRCVAANGTITVAPDGYLHACEHDASPLCFWKEWRTLDNHPRWCAFLNNGEHVCPLF